MSEASAVFSESAGSSAAKGGEVDRTYVYTPEGGLREIKGFWEKGRERLHDFRALIGQNEQHLEDWLVQHKKFSSSLMISCVGLLVAGSLFAEAVLNKPPANPVLAAPAPTTPTKAPTIEMTPTKELVVKPPPGSTREATPTEQPATVTPKKDSPTPAPKEPTPTSAPAKAPETAKKIDKEITPKNFHDNFEAASSFDVIYQAALAQNKRSFQLSPINENNFYINGILVTAPDGVIIRAQESGKVLTQDEYFDFTDAYKNEKNPGIISSAVVLVAPGGISLHKGPQVLSARTISGQENDEGQILIPEGADYKFLEPFGKSVKAGTPVASVKGPEPFSLYTRKTPRAEEDLFPSQMPNRGSTSLDEYAKAPNGKVWYLPADSATSTPAKVPATSTIQKEPISPTPAPKEPTPISAPATATSNKIPAASSAEVIATPEKERVIDREITPENFLNNFEFVTKEQLLKLSAEREDKRIFPFEFVNYKNVTISGKSVTAPDGFYFLATNLLAANPGKFTDTQGYYEFLYEYMFKGGSKEKPMTLVALFTAGKIDEESMVRIAKTNIGLGLSEDVLQIATGADYEVVKKIGDQVQPLDKLLSFKGSAATKKYRANTVLSYHMTTSVQSDEATVSGKFGVSEFPPESDFALDKYLRGPNGKIALMAE